MDKESTRAYLSQLKTIDRRIKCKLEEAERWRDIAENRSSHISEIKVQTSSKPDKMAEAVTRALEYEEESRVLANQLVENKYRLIKQIEGLDDNHYLILNMYFVQNMKYKDIQSEMDCTFNNVKKSLRDAVKTFGEKYEKEITEYEQTTLKVP
jgi:DNA-directed RNA polymerase specialized sigma24 family protein